MVFSGIPFIFYFFPLSLLCYFIVPFKWKNYILLTFSLIFYAWGEPIYILLMIFSSVVDYINGRCIYKYRKKQAKKRFFLILSIIINLSMLGFFKYSDFFIQNINNIFNLDIPLLKLGLPIGISFFTFQTMSYSIDVYRGEVKPEKNFFTFMTYVSMFPQLIAGPIVRYETVAKELKKRKITLDKFSKGLIRFLQGLFKKVLIANQVGFIFSLVQSNIDSASVVTAWVGIIAYTLQIYFDFSGYSDMAIGMGHMFGFTYLENFNYPYISKSITEFWRRWHISLSSWFKDYVYIPLGGSRVSKFKHIRNIFIVWILTGFWHGASWNFIIWGLYFAVILLIEKLLLKNILEMVPNFIRHIYTLFLIIIGWLIFAFDDMHLLANYASHMFGIANNSFVDNTGLFYIINYAWVFILGILLSMPIYPMLKDKIKNTKYEIIVDIILYIIYICLFFITISYLVSDTYNPFLYFRF